jgi:predicted  nucleic acid-binding Zn-ribbon protein
VTDALDLEHLLAVQDSDTTITQLQHRRDALPETTGLRAIEAQLATFEAGRAEATTRRNVLAAAQKDLEAQIAVVTERRQGIEQRMYAATGSSARDLQAMNDEVTHLAARRAELEEVELESMLEQDPIDAELREIDEQTAPLLAQADEVRAEILAQQDEIDTELAAVVSARAEQAALLPAALVGRYETLRTRLKGTGAARMIRNRCDGCHLELSSGEVERIRALPAGEVATCEQCGRILVPV